jgi:plastocyanin
MTGSRIRFCITIAVVLVAMAACSDKSKVGSQSLLNVKDKASQPRLGETTTTTASAQSTTSVAGALRQSTTTTSTTAPKAATTTSTTAAPTPTININGDKSGKSQFEPSQLTVYAGTLVKWQNNDTVARSVVASDNTFRSPPIPPGGSWTYKPGAPGNYLYQDGTRPYANGNLQVVAK